MFNFFNPLIYSVKNWPSTLLKSCGAHAVISLKRVWPFFNIKNERAK